MDAGCYVCSLCRKRRLDDWFIRCICEARYHQKICFLTLTYNDENLPLKHQLSYEDVAKFFKRLRKNSGNKFRYFLCGEYGSKHSRPHYHAVLYGLDEKDKDVINRSWNKGFIHIGTFTPRALRYTMKYFMKTIHRSSNDKHYDEKFFCLASRRPGLGYQYLIDHYDQLAKQGYIAYRGRKHWLPRYFIKKIKDEDLNANAYLEFARARWIEYTDELAKNLHIEINPYRFEPFGYGYRDPETGKSIPSSTYIHNLKILDKFLQQLAHYRDIELTAAAKLKRKY